MLKKVLRKIYYDPYSVARQNSRISLNPEAILLKSVNFSFMGVGGTLSIGKDSMIGCNFIFESNAGNIVVGNRTYISGGTHLTSRNSIRVGDDVTIAWGCYLYDHDSHSLDWRERANDIRRQNLDYRAGRSFIASKDWTVVKSAPIVVCDKAWIGFDAVILKGVTIGEGAVVAARSVVTKDVPAWSVVAGNPAVVVKSLEQPTND